MVDRGVHCNSTLCLCGVLDGRGQDPAARLHCRLPGPEAAPEKGSDAPAGPGQGREA
jgi:hypothetical protein